MPLNQGLVLIIVGRKCHFASCFFYVLGREVASFFHLSILLISLKKPSEENIEFQPEPSEQEHSTSKQTPDMMFVYIC